MTVNLAEAKTNLSRLVDLASHGETIIIAKNNHPLAELVPHKPGVRRQLGLLKGQFTTPDNFWGEDSDINALFYGDAP
jgi:prevent-host-death family protein